MRARVESLLRRSGHLPAPPAGATNPDTRPGVPRLPV
jgi:hypothetical protein